MRSDYLELNLYLDHFDEDIEVEVWAHMKDRSMLRFPGVRSNPVRYHGFWSIGYDFVGRRANAEIVADEVAHFTVINPVDNQPLSDADRGDDDA